MFCHVSRPKPRSISPSDYQILFQLTFVDEVGSQLEGLELTRNGTEVHVSGSTGRQLAPGLLYIDDKKQNSAKVKLKIS